MSRLAVATLFRRAVLARCEVECMATQDAIEALAGECGDRRRLLEWLERATPAELCDAVMVAWAHAPLKLATGIDRDGWLRIIG